MADAKKLRDHYDSTDQSSAFESAEVVDAADELLVSTSIRLSKSTLDKVRALAREAGVPATTLMREWIEARVEGGPAGLVVEVEKLQKLISTSAHRAS
jgi:predicted DNA-binding protein